MGIVYMLSWNGLGYIGSTILTMNRRMRNHHKDYKKWLNGTGWECKSSNIIKNEGYEIIIIEEVENETKEECREREQWWIDFYNNFGKLENKYRAYGLGDTTEYQREYNKKHREKKLQQGKEYRQKNKEKLAIYQKEYRLKKKLLTNNSCSQYSSTPQDVH